MPLAIAPSRRRAAALDTRRRAATHRPIATCLCCHTGMTQLWRPQRGERRGKMEGEGSGSIALAVTKAVVRMGGHSDHQSGWHQATLRRDKDPAALDLYHGSGPASSAAQSTMASPPRRNAGSSASTALSASCCGGHRLGHYRRDLGPRASDPVTPRPWIIGAGRVEACPRRCRGA